MVQISTIRGSNLSFRSEVQGQLQSRILLRDNHSGLMNLIANLSLLRNMFYIRPCDEKVVFSRLLPRGKPLVMDQDCRYQKILSKGFTLKSNEKKCLIPSHCEPVYWMSQIQSYPFPFSLHVPPLRHGFGWHTVGSELPIFSIEEDKRRSNRKYCGELKGGSRHKTQHYEEKVIFYIRHFCNCSIFHRDALARRAACLDPRLKRIQSSASTVNLTVNLIKKITLAILHFMSRSDHDSIACPENGNRTVWVIFSRLRLFIA